MRGLAAVLLVLLASSCVRTYQTTARLHHAQTLQCVSEERALRTQCQSTNLPPDQCRALLEEARVHCDQALARICQNGKGCP